MDASLLTQYTRQPWVSGWNYQVAINQGSGFIFQVPLVPFTSGLTTLNTVSAGPGPGGTAGVITLALSNYPLVPAVQAAIDRDITSFTPLEYLVSYININEILAGAGNGKGTFAINPTFMTLAQWQTYVNSAVLGGPSGRGFTFNSILIPPGGISGTSWSTWPLNNGTDATATAQPLNARMSSEMSEFFYTMMISPNMCLIPMLSVTSPTTGATGASFTIVVGGIKRVPAIT